MSVTAAAPDANIIVHTATRHALAARRLDGRLTTAALFFWLSAAGSKSRLATPLRSLSLTNAGTAEDFVAEAVTAGNAGARGESANGQKLVCVCDKHFKRGVAANIFHAGGQSYQLNAEDTGRRIGSFVHAGTCRFIRQSLAHHQSTLAALARGGFTCGDAALALGRRRLVAVIILATRRSRFAGIASAPAQRTAGTEDPR